MHCRVEMYGDWCGRGLRRGVKCMREGSHASGQAIRWIGLSGCVERLRGAPGVGFVPREPLTVLREHGKRQLGDQRANVLLVRPEPRGAEIKPGAVGERGGGD